MVARLYSLRGAVSERLERWPLALKDSLCTGFLKAQPIHPTGV